jgi:hypothetical protein
MTVPKTDLYYSTSLLFHVIDSWLLSHLSFEMHKAESFAIAEATPLFFFWYSMLIFFRGVNSMFSGVHRIAVYGRAIAPKGRPERVHSHRRPKAMPIGVFVFLFRLHGL